MDYTELLFAASVRDLASGIRHKEAMDNLKLLQAESEDPGRRDTGQAKWSEAHPVSGYIPEALKRIQDTALFIRALPSEGL